MSYSVLKRENGVIMIVAKERISDLHDVIGDCEELFVVKGDPLIRLVLVYSNYIMIQEMIS